MLKFYDTSSLLLLQDKVFQEPFYISFASLKELEGIKTSVHKDEDTKFRSRNIVRLLDKNADKYTVVMGGKETAENLGIEFTNDNIIIAGCYQVRQTQKVILYTDDILMKLVARSLGLGVCSARDEIEHQEEYGGYKEVALSDDEMAYFYEHLYEEQFGCLVNQYLLLKNSSDETVDKRKWNGKEYVPLSFKPINNDLLGKIKPRNLEQELAFDLLQDNNIPLKIITGCFGSGKDYLMVSTAIQYLLTQKYKKIVWVRNNIEVKNTKPIGFLPSGVKEKLLPFAMPMADHLGGLFGLESYLNSGSIEIEHFGFMRGRDYKDTIILCSEAENMTKEHLQLLISRVGEKSTLWINGDSKQVDDKIFEANSGLQYTVNKLKGIEQFGYIQLQKTERSKTAQLADLLD